MADKKDDEKPDPKKMKYLGKFESDEELAKAYEKLEKKLGEQGEDLGLHKKQFAEAQKAMQTYAEQMNNYKQYADWYAANEQALKLYQNWAQTQGQQPQPQTRQTVPANGRQPLDILTPEEREALFSESAKRFQDSIFKPWQDQFSKQLQSLADERTKQISDSARQQQQAFTEVLWRTLQRVVPEDKIKSAREWHEQAMQLAQIQDPMKAADEWLSMKHKGAEYEDKIKALEADRDKWQKQAMPSFGGSGEAAAGWAAKPDDAPQSRQDRFSKVIADTKEQAGVEASRDFFGGGR